MKQSIKIFFLFIIVICLHLFFSGQAYSQSKKKKATTSKSVSQKKKPITSKTSKSKKAPVKSTKQSTRDFKNIKTPVIKSSAPNIQKNTGSDDVIEEELSEDLKKKVEKSKPVYFQPKKELTLVNEDTNTINEGETSIVEISEELKIDCVWVKLTEYYSIWDSKRVNPYHIDNSKFSDTIPLLLYDTLNNMHWSMPLTKTYTTSKFGMRGYRWHYGTDLKLNMGDSILACFDGIVRIKGYDPKGYGYYIMLRHYNGLETLYGHMSEQKVEVGQIVKAGELIGLGGNTGRSSGPHLHFEVRYQGNAIDAEDMYDFKTGVLLSDEFVLTPNDFSYITKAARKVLYHKVRRGETLSSISNKYGVSVKQICDYNRISSRTKLSAGRRLRIK